MLAGLYSIRCCKASMPCTKVGVCIVTWSQAIFWCQQKTRRRVCSKLLTLALLGDHHTFHNLLSQSMPSLLLVWRSTFTRRTVTRSCTRCAWLKLSELFPWLAEIWIAVLNDDSVISDELFRCQTACKPENCAVSSKSFFENEIESCTGWEICMACEHDQGQIRLVCEAC